MGVEQASRRRGAPPRISLDDILDGALEIVDRDGLDALSLRTLAARLGVTPMSLYRYVDGVDGLLDRVVSRLIERSAPGLPASTSWHEAVVAYANALRHLLAEHPAYLNSVLRRPIANRPALEAVDGLIGALRQAGLSPQAAADSYATIYAFCVGFAALEAGRAGARERDSTAPESLGDALSGSGLPHLEEGAAYLARGFDEVRFHMALEVICDGIAAACNGRESAGR